MNNNPDPASLSAIDALLERIFNLALPIGGMVVFIMLIVGGFRFLTSGGDPQKIEAAQKTLTMAVVGLLVAIAAFFILQLIASFTGIGDSLFEFSITGN